MNMAKYKKNIVIIMVIVCILISISTNTFSATLSLEKIVDKFNSSNPMAEHLKNTYNSTVDATINGNKIILNHNNSPFSDSKIQTVEFILEDNILSTKIKESTESLEYMGELSMAWMLIDCIGQLNGYEKEAFYETLKGTGENYKNYTLSNEGLEIKVLDDSTEIKVDLSKNFPILNASTETNNNINTNTTNTNTNNNSKNINKNDTIINANNKNNTNIVSNSKIPNTGYKDNILIILLLIILGCIIYNVYRRYKDIS